MGGTLKISAKFRRRLFKKKNVFEGWYVRVLEPKKSINLAFILAVSLYEDDPHAFIQVFDGNKGENRYYRYPVESFSFRDKTLHVGESSLSFEHIAIRLPDFRLDGEIAVTTDAGKRSSMGFFRHLPLECFQEVVYLAATVQGEMETAGEKIPFSAASYMEKTYGKSFPFAWFWLQTNTFAEKGTALSMAGGLVPFKGFRIFGFFAHFHHAGRTHLFSTHNMSSLDITEEEDHVRFVLKKRRCRLIVEVRHDEATVLVGPGKNARMRRDVEETLSARAHVTLEHGRRIVFQAEGAFAGFEYTIEKKG